MISDKKLQEIIGFTPHDCQKEILECKEREIIICAGRRFGKSAICAYIALKTLLEGDDRKKPVKVWIVSPTYDLSQKVFSYLVEWFLKVVPSQRAGISWRPFPQIKTARGSIVQCKSAENPTGLLGEELDLLIIDECSRIKREIWETYLMATVLSRHGKTFFISTPFGKNWFYDKWMFLKESGSAFQFTSYQNKENKEEELERIRKALPEDIFNQEYLAKFLDSGATVFRNIKKCIFETSEERVQGVRYFMGLDLAKFRDFTCITVVSDYSHQVVHFERFNKLPYTLQKERILKVANDYSAKVIIDSLNVGAAMADELRAEGVEVYDFKTTGTISKDLSKKGTKEKMIEKLAMLFEQENIKIPNEQVLIDELESFSYEMTDSGNIRYSAPQGLNDDCVFSLALACWELYGKAGSQQRLAHSLINSSKKKVFQYQ
jgi:hypothetical protein